MLLWLKLILVDAKEFDVKGVKTAEFYVKQGKP